MVGKLRCDGSSSFIELVLQAGAEGRIAFESGFRLLFLTVKAGKKGYTWWKRTSLAEHWRVHKSTITRDYELWSRLGFVKLRSNPFKASANLTIFPWSEVWEDAVWENREKVASMLPELREAFQHKGRLYATQNGRTNATLRVASPFNEKPNGKRKQQRASVDRSDKGSRAANGEVVSPQSENRPNCSSGSSSRGNEEGVDGYSEIRSLFDRYHVRTRPGQIQTLIESGRAQRLTIYGILAFVEHKLREKRDRNDAVYSATLLITSISDLVDLHRWATKAGRCDSYFSRGSEQPKVPQFSIDRIRNHLSRCMKQLRDLANYAEIAEELDRLTFKAEEHVNKLEALEECLINLEKRMIEIGQSRQTEEEIVQLRAEVNSMLAPYRGKLNEQQLSELRRQAFERLLIEAFDLPRLSLFYAPS